MTSQEIKRVLKPVFDSTFHLEVFEVYEFDGGGFWVEAVSKDWEGLDIPDRVEIATSLVVQAMPDIYVRPPIVVLPLTPEEATRIK